MHKHFVTLWAVVAFCFLALPLWAQTSERTSTPAPKASLGILVEATAKDAEQQGVRVRQVLPDGPAAKAGMQTGDIITRADNRGIEDYDDLINALAQHKPGDQLNFQVVRDGQAKTLQVTLGTPQASAREKPGRYYGRQEGETRDQEKTGAFLGVQTVPTDELNQRLRKRLGVSGDAGLVILEVVPESPAAKTGLRHGDVITRVDGKEVSEPQELREAIHKAGIGKEVALEVLRGDQKREFRAKLEEAPGDVRLFTPRLPGAKEFGRSFPGLEGFQESQRRLEQLQRQVERLEKRVRELEQRRPETKP